MRLHRIRVEHVRGIPAAEVVLGDGVTVVEAPNESGKTSLFDAFELLLREKHGTTKQVVKDLQPRGLDVGSLVEAELTVGDTHLTVRKCFNRDRRTELDIHAPARRQLTGNDAHDQLRRILEEGTDLALFEALRFRQGRPLDSLALADSEQLARQLDASAGGTGETGDDALYDRIVAEFERYHTPTGQPRRIVKDAEAALAAADAEVARLEATVTELATAADRVQELDRERRRLDGLLSELQPAVAEHRRKVERIATVRAELEGARSQRRAAASDLDRAMAELEAREQQLAQIDELQRRLDERTRLAAQARDLLMGHQERLDRLAGDLEAAEAAEAAARAARTTARAAADLTARRDELWAARERQRRVATALDEAETAAAFLADHPMTPAQLERIHQAADELRLLEARLGDAAPTVRLVARQDVDVDLDGVTETLAAGAALERQVPDELRLAIGAVADLHVRAGSSLAERRAEADAVRRRLADLCADVGVADPAAADELARTRADHQRAIDHRDGVLARELDGTSRAQLDDRVRRLQAQVTELEDRLRGDDDQLSLVTDPATDDITRLEAAEEASRAATSGLRRDQAALTAEVQRLRDGATGADAAVAHDREELGAVQQRLARARRDHPDDALAGAVSDAEKEVGRADDALAGATAELEQLHPDQVELLADNAEQQLTRAAQDLDIVREELAGLRATIEVRGGQGVGEAADAARAERDRRRDHVAGLQARATAARTLKEAFESAREQAYAAYREPLRARIVQAGRLVFGSDLDVQLDEELAVVSRTLHGTTLAFEQLSAGAREQLAILTALAAADLAGDGGVPLVLDDTLGYTDPQRLERLGAVLGRVRGPQVIVLTCDGARFQAVGGARVVRLRDVTDAA